MYPFGLGVIKISVLLLYHELFPCDNFRTIIFCTMGFIGAMTIACTLAFAFQCTPVKGYWVMSMWAERHCVNGGAIFTSSAVLSMVTDIFILALPLRYLIGNIYPDCVTRCSITGLFATLPISLREKIQVILLMSLGGLTCIASVMRFSAIRKVFRSSDASWDGYELSFWSACEYHLAIITACIPTIKPLYVKAVNKILALIRKSPTTIQEMKDTYVAPRSKFVQPEPEFLMEA